MNNDQDVVTLDNMIVEAHLGKSNVFCLDDLVHELTICGPSFNSVINFLG
jgi:large subunit ribosomal protein L7e